MTTNFVLPEELFQSWGAEYIKLKRKKAKLETHRTKLEDSLQECPKWIPLGVPRVLPQDFAEKIGQERLDQLREKSKDLQREWREEYFSYTALKLEEVSNGIEQILQEHKPDRSDVHLANNVANKRKRPLVNAHSTNTPRPYQANHGGRGAQRGGKPFHRGHSQRGGQRKPPPPLPQDSSFHDPDQQDLYDGLNKIQNNMVNLIKDLEVKLSRDQKTSIEKLGEDLRRDLITKKQAQAEFSCQSVPDGKTLSSHSLLSLAKSSTPSQYKRQRTSTSDVNFSDDMAPPGQLTPINNA